jgi:hypothetical protein
LNSVEHHTPNGKTDFSTEDISFLEVDSAKPPRKRGFIGRR